MSSLGSWPLIYDVKNYFVQCTYQGTYFQQVWMKFDSLKLCCDVIDDVIMMKDNVLYYIYILESESAIRLKLS